MLNIVGRKIVMQKGDYEAINIVVIDSKGKSIPLSTTDSITLRMKYKLESSASLQKTAEVHTVDDDVYHIIVFNPQDTISLLEGDYEYDVVLEHGNKRFTIIPKSIFTLEESMYLPTEDSSTSDTTDDSEETDTTEVPESTESEEESEDDVVVIEPEEDPSEDFIVIDTSSKIDYDRIITSTPLVGTLNIVEYARAESIVDSELIIF